MGPGVLFDCLRVGALVTLEAAWHFVTRAGQATLVASCCVVIRAFVLCCGVQAVLVASVSLAWLKER